MLEDMICAEAPAGEEWLVMLGDYIDRGPRSAEVIDHLLAPAPPGFRRICLTGNHEMMMLGSLTGSGNGINWLANGGDQTLRSYGMDPQALIGEPRSRWPAQLMSLIPQEHIEFLQSLALSLSLPGLVCVHAGLRPGIAVEQQSETDLLWLRPDDDTGTGDGRTLLVHGHTPVLEPYISANRINIDTGAFATGRLTAVTLDPSLSPRFSSTANER